MTSPLEPVPDPQQPLSIPPEAARQTNAQAIEREAARQIGELRELVSQLQKPQFDFDPATIRKGVVLSIEDAGNAPTLTANVSGATEVAVAGIRWIDSYAPTVGDTVLLLKQGADILVIGRVADNTSNWITAPLSSGFTHNGNSNGNVQYRRVWDNGSWKVQWRGAAARSSGTTIISGLPAEYRPSNFVDVIARRNLTHSTVVGIQFQPDGDVILRGGNTSPGWFSNFTSLGTGSTFVSTGFAGGHGHGNTGTTSGHLHSTFSVGSHSHSGGSHSHGIGSHAHSGGTFVNFPTYVTFQNIEYFL